MSEKQETGANYGVQSSGQATTTISNSAFGNHPMVVNAPAPAAGGAVRGPQDGRWDAGVITVLSVEMNAVIGMLGAAGPCQKHIWPDGSRFYEARLGNEAVRKRVVATQALEPGQRSAALALGRLREHYAPAIVALTGIATGGMAVAALIMLIGLIPGT